MSEPDEHPDAVKATPGPAVVKPVRFPPDLLAAIDGVVTRSKTEFRIPLNFTDFVLRACRRDLDHYARSRRPKRRRVRNTPPAPPAAQPDNPINEGT